MIRLRPGPALVASMAAVVVGSLTYAVRYPGDCEDSFPPICSNVFGRSADYDQQVWGPAIAAALIAFVFVWAAGDVVLRRRHGERTGTWRDRVTIYVFAGLVFLGLALHFGPYGICPVSSDNDPGGHGGGIFSRCPTSDLESNVWDLTPFCLLALTVLVGELLAYRRRRSDAPSTTDSGRAEPHAADAGMSRRGTSTRE